METHDVIDLTREAMTTTMLIGAPILIVGMLVGLGIGLLQALTQIQDQTVSFVPKIVFMVAAVAFCLPWLVEHMLDYSHDVIANIPHVISGNGR